MTKQPSQRWIALLALPVLMASASVLTLTACQRAGEDSGASSGASGGGTSQSGAERSSRSDRPGSATEESSTGTAPSR